MHHNCGFLEQVDKSLHQQDITGLSKCIILDFKAAAAVSAGRDKNGKRFISAGSGI